MRTNEVEQPARDAGAYTRELGESIAASLRELWDVRGEMLAAEEALAQKTTVHPDHCAGARNLAHYLALRMRELRPLQERLAHLGLSSLGRCEGHALASIEAVIGLLGELAGRGGQTWTPSSPGAFEQGRKRLEAHTSGLLGPAREGRLVRILVTLAPEAAEDMAQLCAWIEQGMDCVRINCAHDGPAQWERMLAQVRRAGQRTGRRVHVLMDLAGPKLRTGPIEAGPPVLKIRPERDALGRVRVPARVWLAPDGALPVGAEDVYALPVPAGLLAEIRAGDELGFVDARGSRRRLRVVLALDHCAWAESERTCYVIPGTELVRDGEPLGKVGALPRLEGVIHLARGDRLVLTRALEPGHGTVRDAHGQVLLPARVGCTLGEVFAQACAGEHVWFDDGRVGGVIREQTPEHLVIEITHARRNGENLRADKGINLPDSRLELPALTPKDLEDLRFAVRHADAVGLSFVQRAADVRELCARLSELGRPDCGLVLKIETRRAFERLPELLFAALQSPRVGVMIARGDLAVECGWERLAEAQEEILWLCEAAHVPAIWATQVLESLSRDGRPSRAEITDAAMSERAECVMLNKGPHLGESVAALDGILRRMQAHQHKKSSMLRPLRLASRFGTPE